MLIPLAIEHDIVLPIFTEH